jgi:hypothetical protein
MTKAKPTAGSHPAGVQPGMGELTQRPAIGTGRWSFARPGGWSAPKERRETNGVK